MRSGNLSPALDPAQPSEHGRKPVPLVVFVPVVLGVIFLLSLIARFLQDIPPPPPVTSIIVRVPLSLDSAPQGARIIADDHDIGVTPLRSSLPVGVHALELQRDGFAPLRRRIELVPGSPLAVELPLTPVPGTLRLITDVDDAEVTLDGRPLTGVEHRFDADSVAPGRHKLNISSQKAHASLSFEVKAAEPPAVQPPQASNLTVAAISRFADTGTVVSNEAVRIGLTRGPSVQAGPDVKRLPVAPGQNAELLGTGLVRHTVPVTHAAVPSLSVLAALQTGSLVIATGQDDVHISINGKTSKRQPQKGRLYFWGLMPGLYVVRVEAPSGAARSLKVAIEKDKQTSAEFLPGSPPRVAVSPPPAKASPMPKPEPNKTQASAVRIPAPVVVARAEPKKPVTPAQPPPVAVVRPPKRTAAAPAAAPLPQRAVLQGLARFVVKTPGARVTVRRVDVPDPLTRVIVTDSLRLPAGRWMVNATAPGFEPYTSYFLVNPAGPADVFVRLMPERGGKKKHAQ